MQNKQEFKSVSKKSFTHYIHGIDRIKTSINNLLENSPVKKEIKITPNHNIQSIKFDEDFNQVDI